MSHIKLKNIFNLMTKSGHQIDTVKSAIQKYARRGMSVEMLQAVSEMDTFSMFQDSEDINVTRAVKNIRTNMINRLLIILFEDVSFSQIEAFTTVVEKIKEWEDEGRTDKNTLAEIVSVISNAKKLRMPSFLRATYGKGEKCSINKDQFLEGIDNEKIDCVEWIYHNDEEALKLLASYDFSGKEIILPMITARWKKLKPTKSNAGSNERFMFIIVPWLWIMYKNYLNESELTSFPTFDKQTVIDSTAYLFNKFRFSNRTK